MNTSLSFYWRLLLRRLPAMMALFLLCTLIGLAMAVRMPTIYQSSARLIVEDPQIPDSMAASTVQTSASNQIEITRQQLMTRANLLDIARRFKVFADVDRMTPDEIVKQMQASTSITSTSTTRRGAVQPTLVSVSFTASKAQTTADVVNEYVTRITNANVENRTGQAEGTLDFFRQEVDRLAAELDRASSAIGQFQGAHADALPDDLSFRQSRQSLLQERLAGITRERAALTDQRARTIEVFKTTGQVSDASAAQSPDQKLLQGLEGQLDAARAVYSETAPQVAMLRSRVEQLTARIAAATPEATPDKPDATGNPLLDVQLAQIDAQSSGLESQITSTEAELATLSTSIAATPANAIVLQGLQRDYDNIRQQYDAAVQRLAQASVGERIELTARGQRISLIEGANVPSEPFSPNRLKIAATGAAAGMALAGGLFLLLEVLNRAVRIPSEITKTLGIVPLATIPYIESRARKLFRRSLRVASLIVVVIGVPAALWAIDTYYLPLDLLAQKVLVRLGLA